MSIEEWWGRTFERRGSVHAKDANAWTQETVSRMNTVDLLEMIRSEDNRSVRGLLAHMEMRRREAWTARAAFVVSVLALVVSVAAAFVAALRP